VRTVLFVNEMYRIFLFLLTKRFRCYICVPENKNALWNRIFVLGKNCPFMTNNKNLGKRIKNQNPNMYNTQEHNKFIYKVPTMLLEKSWYTQKFYLFIATSFLFSNTCYFSVFVENCILLPKGCILYLQPLRWNSWLQNDRDIRLLNKFLTVYTCITFHFFALALGEKVSRNTGNFFCFIVVYLTCTIML
jgi:hypothetical protein